MTDIGKLPHIVEPSKVYEQVNLKLMKQDLIFVADECTNRGLRNSEKWTSELLCSLEHVEVDIVAYPLPLYQQLGSDFFKYKRIKSYFDLKEFDRAAYFSKDDSQPLLRFLHFYSRYLSGEKKKNEDTVDPLSSVDEHNAEYLKKIHREISSLIQNSTNDGMDEDILLDAWLLWLYGIVLKKLDLKRDAMKILCLSIRKNPVHWGAWLELALLISTKDMVDTLDIPRDCWMYKFFIAHVCLLFNIPDESSLLYAQFEESGLSSSSYIKAQMALCAHAAKDIDQAISIFKEIEELDPYRLDNVDTFSNLLFVKESRMELAHLAHRVDKIDKYRVETCSVIGNYYSIRGQHEKSVQYFQRALRLNPSYLAGWTLMGHEYMEMKNTNAAIQCYRQAIEVNKSDFRAWYGLGQTYEILKLYAYCIYYYKQAHQLNPYDSRILVAMGDCFEKLDKFVEAKKCYHKAINIGDIEDLALLRLARLYDKQGEGEKAAAVYEKFLKENDGNSGPEEEGLAYMFLANHYLQKQFLDLAHQYAFKCTLIPETRESGKTILNIITTKRQNEDDKATDVQNVESPELTMDEDLPLKRHLSFSP